MIDSIANSLDMNVSQNTQTARTERMEKVEKAESAEKAARPVKLERSGENISRKYDRVELTNEARDYLTAEKSERTTANSEVTTKSSAGESSVNLNISTNEEISSDELYSYTDSELLDLVLNGDISRSDYNAELAKREED